jgi:hypothetical protein
MVNMSSKPVVLVLGVFHFRYVEDILEPYRQKEIHRTTLDLSGYVGGTGGT